MRGPPSVDDRSASVQVVQTPRKRALLSDPEQLPKYRLRRMDHSTSLSLSNTRKLRAISTSMTATDYDVGRLDARQRVELMRQRSQLSFEQQTIDLDAQFRTAPAGRHLVHLELDAEAEDNRSRRPCLRPATSSLVANAMAGRDDSSSSTEDDPSTVISKKKKRKCVSFLETLEPSPSDSASVSKSEASATLVVTRRPRCSGDPDGPHAHAQSPIHSACRKGDYLVVKHILSFYVGRDGYTLVNAACACGLTPLQVACAAGHVPIATLLLEQQANPNRRPRRRTQLNDNNPRRRTRSCLALAVSLRSRALVDVLLDYGALVDEDSLVTASALGELAVVRTLLGAPQRLQQSLASAQRDVFSRVVLAPTPEGDEVDEEIDAETETETETESESKLFEIAPMWIFNAATVALQHEHPALVQVLLGNGSTPRSKQLVPKIALAAAGRGDIKLLRCVSKMYDPVLLVTAQDACGSSLLHLAVKSNSTKCVMLTIRLGVDVNATDGGRITALYMACARGVSPIVQLLVRAGASCERMGPNDETPLHIAAQENQLLCVETLLKDGSTPADVTTSDHRTPLHLACQCGHTEVARCLLEHGADVNARTTNGETPLLKATRMSHLETIKLLVANHADTSVLDSQGDRKLALALTSLSTASTTSSRVHEVENSLRNDEDTTIHETVVEMEPRVSQSQTHARPSQSNQEEDMNTTSGNHRYPASQSAKHTSFKSWLRSVVRKK